MSLRLARLATAGAVGVLLAGCTTAPTDACATSSVTPGRWRYSAVQDSPVRATMEGTLVISSVQCGDFSGALDVLLTEAQGIQRRMAGPVTGRAASGSAIRFDADIGALTRQHVGVLASDSLQGSWLSIAGSATASGTFHGRRENGS